MPTPPVIPPLTFPEVRERLALPDAAAVWNTRWTASERHHPLLGKVLPDEAFVGEACTALAFTADVRQALLDAVPMFTRNPALARLFQHCHFLFFERSDCPRDEVMQWPMVPAAADPCADLFPAFVYLCGLPTVLSRNRFRGIPDATTYETLHDLELWIRWHRDLHGRWGFSNLGWLWFHFQSRLFSLGRLQFCLDTYRFDYRAFHDPSTGQYMLLAPAGASVREDGQLDGTSGIRDPRPFVTALSETRDRIDGHPVSPDGCIQRQAVVLRKRTWTEVLRNGDAALSVHIPAIGPLTPDACQASYERARVFFASHFPEFRFNAMFSVTWLFDGQLARLLPADSNIVRFQRGFHLFPVPGATDGQTWERVFGRRYDDPGSAPRDTALRRAILDHVAAGGHMHIGGGVRFVPHTAR